MSKKERLFVIMEVEKEGTKVSECSYYNIVGSSNKEWVRCKPSRIIPESRLRYGMPKEGETYWESSIGWNKAILDFKDNQCLILDPEPEEKKDEWDEWVADAPICVDGNTRRWLKRMPRREDGTT